MIAAYEPAWLSSISWRDTAKAWGTVRPSAYDPVMSCSSVSAVTC